MKFVVRRASLWMDKESPCKDAVYDNIVLVETRTFRTPEEYNARFSHTEGEWFSVGTNHRIDERGYITRDNGMQPVWIVELNTLDELVEFCDKYGDVVIGDCLWNKAYKEILIYDDFIE